MKQLLIVILVFLSFSIMLPAQNYVFEDYFELDSNLIFEEKGYFPQYPVYNINDNHLILSTDLQGHRVSLYDSSGHLINQFGGYGKGPGDFEYPMTAIPINNNLLVAEFSGKLSLFTNNGDSLLNIFNAKVLPLSNIISLAENKVLLIGNLVGETNSSALLHIFDLSTGVIENSFLELPFSHSDYAQVFRMYAQIGVASIYDGNIIAMVVPFNKKYTFSINGDLLSTDKLQLKEFIEPEITSKSLSRDALFEYTKTFSVIDRLFFFNNGSSLIQYAKVIDVDSQNPEMRSTKYNLAYLNKNGELIFDISDTPELVAVDNQNSTLFFRNRNQDPSFLLRGKIKSIK